MSLLSLPRDILVLLPDYIHNIEDYTSLTSTCRSLRTCLIDATTPSTILRLAAAQSKIFFRPSPHFLVAAVASDLGDWARESEANEAELAARIGQGVDGLLELALEHCGLEMERIRELWRLKGEVVNPVTNIIDQCVGDQWCDVEDFWDGGRSDAYTIRASPNETFFHLAIYGELFSPDVYPFLYPWWKPPRRTLKVDTRLEYIKYCLPDFATEQGNVSNPPSWLSKQDPRLALKATGPYAPNPNGEYPGMEYNHNLALTWVLNSSRWRPHWKRFRQAVGIEDFVENLEDGWWYDEESDIPNAWRQRLLENVLNCQGLEGLAMISPALSEEERVEKWGKEVRDWRDAIAELDEDLNEEPEIVMVERQATMACPYLLGDLRVCAGGYVSGT